MKIDKKKLISTVKKFSQVKILVVGDIMLDKFIWGNVERISPEAPVPVVNVERESIMPGGAANVINNICALGGSAILGGIIGTDNSGKSVQKLFAKKNVSFSCVHKKSHRPTIVKTRIIAHNQQVVRVDREDRHLISNKIADIILKKITEVLSQIDLICFSDYNKGLASDYFISNLISLSNKKNKKIVVDPKPINIFKFKNCFVLTPNQVEATKSLSKNFGLEKDIFLVGKELLQKLNSTYLLITRGEKGMTLFSSQHKPFTIPAIATEIYDVTGAGDTVISTLGLALATGIDIKTAVFIANLAASIVVRKIGTATCSQSELMKLILN